MTAHESQGSLIERAAGFFDLNAAFRPHPSGASRLPPSPAGRGKGPAAEGSGKGEDSWNVLPADPIADDEDLEWLDDDDDFVPPPPSWDGSIASVDRAALATRGMIVPGAPIGALAEEFRLIKRQLLLTAGALDGAKARTILVGSGKPGDGKTYCAINLALSIAAERDTEVLLVDADFAKPSVMTTLGLEEGDGLLDALADPELDVEELVVRTDVPQLSLLGAGKRNRNDTELLASARTREVLARLLAADPRRMVIFDSPPALAASPASVLALLVGQVMLVVRADRTTEGDVRAAVARLDGCENIQLVLNAVSFVPGGSRFGDYYGEERP